MQGNVRWFNCLSPKQLMIQKKDDIDYCACMSACNYIIHSSHMETHSRWKAPRPFGIFQTPAGLCILL